MAKLNVLIAGCTGYIGLQLTKLLIKHPNVKIKYLCGDTSVGKNINSFDKSLKTNLPRVTKFNKSMLTNIDIIFTALPNGEAQKISKLLNKKNTLIDLSADFRLGKKSYYHWYKKKHQASSNIKKSIYSLPELHDQRLDNYQIISCPGCYPTSILIPLIPLIKFNMIDTKNIVIDSKSGYSGAGRSVHKKYKNKNLYESLRVYGVGFHRHNSEIQQEIKKITRNDFKFNFTPHLIPMFRGILTTIYIDIKKNINQDKILKILKSYYKNKLFIKIAKKDKFLSTNDVINTNYCEISVCKTKYKNKLILISTIDNLIKGGSGQAIQNMNKKFSFDENKGLL